MLLSWNDPCRATPDAGASEAGPTLSRLRAVAGAAVLPAVAVTGILAGVCFAGLPGRVSDRPQLAGGSGTRPGATDRATLHATVISHRVTPGR